MKRKLLISLLVFCPLFLFSQNLDKMPELARRTLLIKKTKELTLKHGPRYWRESTPIISRIEITEENSPGNEDIGRAYYNVKIPYDKTKESFNDVNYVVVASFWADTGTPFAIGFGNGRGFTFFDDDSKSEEVMPYQTLDDLIKEAKELYKRQGIEWKDNV